MGINFDKIKERLKKLNQNGGSNNSWKPVPGEVTRVRILPDPDGDPFKDAWIHYGVGKKGPILCPKRNFDEDCVICDFGSKLWKEGTNESKEEAKKYFATQRYFTRILIREHEDEGLKIWSFSKSLYEKMLTLILKPDYGDITDPEHGTDLEVTAKKKEGMRFPIPEFDPARKESKLSETKKGTKEILDNLPDMESMFDRRTPEEVEQILTSHLNPDVDDDTSTDDERGGKKPDADAVTDVDKAFEQLSGS